MSKKTIVNLFDKHNENSLIAIDIYKPKKVIFLVEEKDCELYNFFQNRFKHIFNNIVFERYIIKNDFIEDFEKFKNCINNQYIINVTGGKRMHSLLLLNIAINTGLDTVYIDVLNKRMYSLGKEISSNTIRVKDLYINEILSLSGSKFIMDSTKLSSNEKIVSIAKKIYANLPVWHKYKDKLRDNNIFIHNYFEINKMKINFKSLKEEENQILNKCLRYLQDIGMIKILVQNSMIEVEFINEHLKGFIFKSGTWLEVIIDSIISEIKEIDQVKNGVVFLWKEEEKVRNEIDVVAVKDSVLICIPCKDSSKYDESALNELEVYSKRIGGEDTKKILIATKEPYKKCVVERAKAMGINLLIIDQDINKLKKQITEIIN